MRSTIFLALQDCVTYTSHFVWHDDVPLVLVLDAVVVVFVGGGGVVWCGPQLRGRSRGGMLVHRPSDPAKVVFFLIIFAVLYVAHVVVGGGGGGAAAAVGVGAGVVVGVTAAAVAVVGLVLVFVPALVP